MAIELAVFPLGSLAILRLEGMDPRISDVSDFANGQQLIAVVGIVGFPLAGFLIETPDAGR